MRALRGRAHPGQGHCGVPGRAPVSAPASALTGRIGHQMRAWFNGPRRLGSRAWMTWAGAGWCEGARDQGGPCVRLQLMLAALFVRAR